MFSRNTGYDKGNRVSRVETSVHSVMMMMMMMMMMMLCVLGIYYYLRITLLFGHKTHIPKSKLCTYLD